MDWNWPARARGTGIGQHEQGERHWLARDQGTAPGHTDLAIFGETVLYWYRLYGTDLVTFRETVLQLSRLNDPTRAQIDQPLHCNELLHCDEPLHYYYNPISEPFTTSIIWGFWGFQMAED